MHRIPLFERQAVDKYDTPKGAKTWDEIIDMYHPELKTVDSFFEISKSHHIADRDPKKKKEKIRVKNFSVSINKDFDNVAQVNNWIKSEGNKIYSEQYNKIKNSYEPYKTNQ